MDVRGNSAIRAAEHDHDIMMQNRHRFRAMATNLFQPLGDSNGSLSWTMMRVLPFSVVGLSHTCSVLLNYCY